MSEEPIVTAKIKRERQVNTYAELAHANDVLLENAEELRSGCAYEFMTVILLAAFKLEAYLNHVGERLIPFWDELEPLPVRSKLEIVRQKVGLPKTYGERPFQTVTPLFRFRNAIAHGKSEFLESENIETGTLEELRRRKPQTKWEELNTLEFAKRATTDMTSIIECIQIAAGFDPNELRRLGNEYSMYVRKPAESNGSQLLQPNDRVS